MKRTVLFLITIVLFSNVNAQKSTNYSLTGSVTDSSIKKIELLFISKDPNFSVENKIIEPADGKFTFSGKLPYPYAVYLRFNDLIRSELFFLDGGTQEVVIKSIDSTLIVTGSKSTDEYKSRYLPKFKDANIMLDLLEDIQKVNSLKNSELKDSIWQEFHKVRGEKKYIAYEYTNQHPDSYVALWDLYFEQRVRGYHLAYKNAFELFPERMKKSPIGLEVASNLMTAQNMDSGANFPSLKLTNYNTDKETFSNFNDNFTLVDFWFSNCSPCIKQFPELKSIYQKYKEKGFQIVSISIDNNSDLWKKTIQDLDLPWIHFLDKGGSNAYNLTIYAYPTTFLLDKKGKIIKKNMTLTDLNKFLDDKL